MDAMANFFTSVREDGPKANLAAGFVFAFLTICFVLLKLYSEAFSTTCASVVLFGIYRRQRQARQQHSDAE